MVGVPTFEAFCLGGSESLAEVPPPVPLRFYALGYTFFWRYESAMEW